MFDRIKSLFEKKSEAQISQVIQDFNKLEKKPVPVEIDLPVQGNEQLDNFKYPRLAASSQCGYTSLAVILSQFIPDATSDKFIKDMIDFFEKEFLETKVNTRFGSSMANHVFMAEFYLKKYNVKKKVYFTPFGGTIEQVIEALSKGYAVGIAGMMTESGHFMVITGYSELRKAFKMQDPYRKFDFVKKRYANQSGLNVYYPVADLLPYLEASSRAVTQGKHGGIRFYYIGD